VRIEVHFLGAKDGIEKTQDSEISNFANGDEANSFILWGNMFQWWWMGDSNAVTN
jgi:hypothetical protein